MRTSKLLLATLVVGLAACAPPRELVTVTDRPVVVAPPEEIAAPAEPAASDLYTGIETGRFDGGKMWTFDHPPLTYFEEEYGFEPDSAWFATAQQAALRFAEYCSASFVSPHGLVMTNHHCARESITDVTRAGEDLLEAGFYASDLSEERKVKDLHVDQLLTIEDVTDRVYAAGKVATTARQAAELRGQRAESLQRSMESSAKSRDSSLVVQVIPLYEGGQYAAYTFRRHKDVRLVMAPELGIGFFGGDEDNFTYPRYNLDMAFFRVYAPDGEPLEPDAFFQWDETGADDGEAVFVVGNPGSTSRLSTSAQLTYLRDVELPAQLEVMRRRASLFGRYNSAYPDSAESYKLRNPYFSLQNSIKSTEGQLDGLRSDWLIPRRGAAYAALEARVRANDSLEALYGSLFDDLAELQDVKRTSARKARAFDYFLTPMASSRILTRAMYGWVYSIVKQRGGQKEQLDPIRKDAIKIESMPRVLEEQFIAARLTELREALGPNDPTMRSLLSGTSIDSLAHRVAFQSALADSAGFVTLLDKNYLASGDASVALIEAIAPLYFTLNQELEGFQAQEAELNARLGRARFAIYGTAIPPDASFSLRVADGRVRGYSYNGTLAPAFTTYYGMFDRHFSHDGEGDWALPARWTAAPPELDRSAEVNLVSTNDITGGNSGSPLLDRDLQVVGLVFDSNIEALSNEYLYIEGDGRTISVDVRGMLEALDDVYDADRLVVELTSGLRYDSEAAADAAVLESESARP